MCARWLWRTWYCRRDVGHFFVQLLDRLTCHIGGHGGLKHAIKDKGEEDCTDDAPERRAGFLVAWLNAITNIAEVFRLHGIHLWTTEFVTPWSHARRAWLSVVCGFLCNMAQHVAEHVADVLVGEFVEHLAGLTFAANQPGAAQQA